eukprot:NODE_11_length_54881_cov_1.430718.p23 type:complete len:287 gc:universal NODE_11_length_54881_cov_1.430718:50231-49371(-)
MLLVLLVLSLSTPLASDKSPKLSFDPVKDFYNKRIIESALQAVQPALKKVINSGVVDFEKEAVTKAPKWLQDTLKEVLDLDPTKPMKDYGAFNRLYKYLYKYFEPILDKWTQVVKAELNLTISRFEINLNEEINTKVRQTLYWRKLAKRDNWYHTQIEKVIKMITNLIDSAVVKTAEQSRDDYGNRIGEEARNIINWFLPDDLKIKDIIAIRESLLSQQFDPDNLTEAEEKALRDFLRNKLKGLIQELQKRVQKFVAVEFQKLGDLVSNKIEAEIRVKAKALLPFY